MDKEFDEVIYDYSEKALSIEEAEKLSDIQKEFFESYAFYKNELSVEEWLPQELHKHLPEKTVEEINEISEKIISSLKLAEKTKQSQSESLARGRSRDSWFASTLLQSTSHMSLQESAGYLHSLDVAVNNANVSMHETVTTKSSDFLVPNMNPNLDGFIAEQHHVNSFNLEAAAKGSSLRAEVQPLKQGQTYTKNGFDVVIKDASGKRIHQYQMKYGSTAEDTIRMIESGNYNNQILVVPADQVEAVQNKFPNKTVTATIGEGNIHSKSLTKEKAKKLQEDVQRGNFIDADWNDFAAKDLALGISKQVGYACLQGAAVSAGMSIAKKVWKGEPIKCEDVIETAIVSGVDFGVKTAVAGALKVASEKGVIKLIPPGTPTSTFSNMAFVAIENVKVLGKVAKGDLTVKEGLDVMQQTTASCVYGMCASLKGFELGVSIGTVLGPIGAAVGGFIGGTVGYMAGSKVAETVVKGVQKVRDKAIEAVKTVRNKIKEKTKLFLRRKNYV